MYSLLYRNIPELSKDIKAQIFTQNKGFNPKTFLTHVHPAAGPEDLRYGREKLKGELSSSLTRESPTMFKS